LGLATQLHYFCKFFFSNTLDWLLDQPFFRT
jgi:hypothetical protein